MMLDLVDIALLRAQYAAACERYRVHAARLAEHADLGQRPTDRLLDDEKQALYELATVRRELLDALAAASQPDYAPSKSGTRPEPPPRTRG